MTSDRDEDLRLLAFQAEFLRRELSFVTRRYDDMRYSAAWTLARPVKRVEDVLHALARRVRSCRPARPADLEVAPEPLSAGSLQETIAARIAAKMGRTSPKL